ncbi:uncharacterized protein LOC129732426 [Wyeomyia smithii]|uniref:uncharacterized protein LOC129732426 n=1 Tax=Wyeomyia smithii TaxID=174621 RepID=UPI002468090C|nr:uncharacterized protein LOC129732426 [Wyeomyia smithii]
MMGWIKIIPSLLVVFAVSAMINRARADFGLNAVVTDHNSIIYSANGINNALKEFDKTVRKNSVAAQTDRVREINKLVVDMTYDIAELSRAVVENVKKALDDRTTPVDEVFLTLGGSYCRMNRYLESNVTIMAYDLNNTVGSAFTSKITQVLGSMNAAIVNISYATAQIEVVIGNAMVATKGEPLSKNVLTDSGPLNVTSSLSTALEQMKVEMSTLTRVIENLLRDMSQIDSYISKFNSTSQSIQQNLNATALSVQKELENVQANLLKRYYNCQNNVKSELGNAILKIDGFSTHPKLQPLLDNYTAEYTRIYYNLFNRNDSDVSDFVNFFQNCTTLMYQLSQHYYEELDSNMQEINDDVTNAYLERNENKEACFNRQVKQIFSHLSNFQYNINNCMGQEKNRLWRFDEVFEKISQLVQYTTQEFVANIVGCSAYSGFANSAVAFSQAEACLKTNLENMQSFQTIINHQLDGIKPINQVEALACRFRLENCMAVYYKTETAAVEVWRDETELCASNAVQ